MMIRRTEDGVKVSDQADRRIWKEKKRIEREIKGNGNRH